MQIGAGQSETNISHQTKALRLAARITTGSSRCRYARRSLAIMLCGMTIDLLPH